MNKIIKIVLATLGAVNVVFDFFIPITVALLAIKIFSLTPTQNLFIVLLGSLSSLYRGISLWNPLLE